MYQITIRVRTDTDPHGLLKTIHDDISGDVHVLAMDYHLIDDRPTGIEHHGGLNTDAITKLAASQQQAT